MSKKRSKQHEQTQNTRTCDVAKSLVRQIRVIREAGNLAGHLTDGSEWVETSIQLRNNLAEARKHLEPLLPQIETATKSMGPIQCGHLSAPTAHALVLQLGEHALNMVDMAKARTWSRQEHEDNVYECAVELAREIGVPPIESWNLLEARLQCEAQSTVRVTDKADNGPRHSRGARAVKPKRPATINERMMGTISENNEAAGWNSPQWARYLKCAKSTVVETSTWKCLGDYRRRAKAERMTDRRRKPKASDSRRD